MELTYLASNFGIGPRISLRSIRATIFTVVIARSEATKQSRCSDVRGMDCFANARNDELK
jgi:hypothetical protein